MSQVAFGDQRWLIAIDIDGTLVDYESNLSHQTRDEVMRVRALGHEVVLATGRSAANAIPALFDVGIDSGHAVCSNGAVTIEIDPADPQGYRPSEIVTFDPQPILSQLSVNLPNAHFAVEDIDGTYRYHRPFPAYALGEKNIETPLEELMHQPVSRVVVLSPEHEVDEFAQAITSIGLSSVSYSIGYTSWLDIAPFGVTKASALEKLRRMHQIKPEQVIVIGDGRNDIPMFEWAQAQGGLAFAMGQAADETKRAATAVTAPIEEHGVAQVLRDFEGILFTRKML
ncbi:MAG: HAD family hydrolase [Micrococcales bacterium]